MTSPKPPIYLDNNATTPLDPRVLESMEPFLREKFGNPSSTSHSYGWQAAQAVNHARKQLAQLIGCDPKEVIWTSGATESNNMVLQGLIQQLMFIEGEKNPHIVTTQVEHKAILEAAKHLNKLWGVDVTFVEPDKYGRVGKEQILNALKPTTKLVSVIYANNEIGTINPIGEIGEALQDYDVFFHSDAAQAAGKVEIDVKKLNVHMMSLSGHKMYGPKGVGALYVSKKDPKVRLCPLIVGGPQEDGQRAGTLNVPAIVGMGTACLLAQQELESESNMVKQLRDELVRRILQAIPNAQLNGHPTDRLCGNASISFSGLSSDLFALGLSGLALSSGSACSSASSAPSYVLKSIGLDDETARSTLRFGLGRFSCKEDIDAAVDKVIAMNEKNKAISIR